MLYTDKECDFILTQLNDSYLTEWEQTFVNSIREARKQGRRLSIKQIEVLSRIWDK